MVEYEPAALAEGRDTILERVAAALLEEWFTLGGYLFSTVSVYSFH